MAEAILQTRDLSVHFGGLVAVNRVSLGVRRGECKSVIGPNGAGKSTLFNLLCGIYKPSQGTVHFKGQNITGRPPYKISRLGLGRAFQIAMLFPNLSVLENVRLAAQSRQNVAGRLLTPADRFKAFTEKAQQALAEATLAGKDSLPAATLAHGDKRKLELAMLLATDPEVLLLDEPTAGMSSDEIPAILELLGRIKATGKTIMLVEHKLDVVMSLSDSIAVLHWGELIADGDPATVSADPRVQQAYLGVAG